jgi:hypothetical protein
MAIERSTELLDVFERVLDRGVVIDAWVTVSLAGVRLIDVEARILVASVSTYLRLADAVASKPAAMAKPFAAIPPPAVPALGPTHDQDTKPNVTPRRRASRRRPAQAAVSITLACAQGCTFQRASRTGRAPTDVRCPYQKGSRCKVAPR